MEINDLPPTNGVTRAYCETCGGPLDLIFAPFRETVSGVEIDMESLPTLECPACGWRTLPDRTRYSIMRAHEIASKEGVPIFKSKRNKITEDFGFTDVPFSYDSDDFYYYPGLERPWNKGFLTPVYFNRKVLAKFDADPTYLVRYASPTYGDIFGEGFSIAFGINRHGHLIMWLGDIAKLPKPEQYYLVSENRPSDHCLASEFYDGQIECIFTEPPSETLLFAARSDFLASAFKLWGVKLALLDDEVLELAGQLTRPVHDTPAQRHAVSDNLNKVHLESIDNDALGKLIAGLSIACNGTGQLKRLQALLESIADNAQVYALMTPFYTLYDFRVSYSHLGSAGGAANRMKSVTDRLGLAEDAAAADIYDQLLEQMMKSYSSLTDLVTGALPHEGEALAMHNRAAMKGRDRNAPCWCGSGLKFKKCHYNREDQERENPWDAVAANRRAFNQKKCWAEEVGLGPCQGSIIRAHTISKGSNLRKIAKDGHVLQYGASIEGIRKSGGKLSVKSIGINEASVFNGFCAYHDRTLFSCIENEPYSGRPDQNLAVAYRTLSRELFGKDAMAELKTILRGADKGHDLPTQISLQALIGELDLGNAAARRELRVTHDALTDALVHQRPAALRSLVIEFDGRLPVMFAGAWSPFTDLYGAPLQTGYVDELLEQVVFASFAGDPGDFICVSWRDTPDAPGKDIADQIDELSGDQKAKLCLQFVVKHIENIFFDPAWFKSLNQGQRDLLDGLALDGVDGLGAPPTVALKPDIEFVLPQTICSTWV